MDLVAAKDLKYLRNAADIAQKYYNLTAEGAKRSFVFDQLVEGWAGLRAAQ